MSIISKLKAALSELVRLVIFACEIEYDDEPARHPEGLLTKFKQEYENQSILFTPLEPRSNDSRLKISEAPISVTIKVKSHSR